MKIAALTGMIALLLTAGLAVAQSPHFIKADAVLQSDGDLVISWKEAGLGDTVSIDYLASASASATYQCVNLGGNCPQAANKQDVLANVSASGTFSAGKNGQITASLTIEPPPSTLECPGNQHVELANVTYADVALTDVTNGVSADIPSSFSVTRFTCP